MTRELRQVCPAASGDHEMAANADRVLAPDDESTRCVIVHFGDLAAAPQRRESFRHPAIILLILAARDAITGHDEKAIDATRLDEEVKKAVRARRIDERYEILQERRLELRVVEQDARMPRDGWLALEEHRTQIGHLIGKRRKAEVRRSNPNSNHVQRAVERCPIVPRT